MASIVYIGAEWCFACKTIKPAVEKLASQFAVKLILLDYDDDLTSEKQETIQKVPTIQIFRDETFVTSYNTNQVQQLEEWLKKNVSLMDASF